MRSGLIATWRRSDWPVLTAADPVMTDRGVEIDTRLLRAVCVTVANADICSELNAVHPVPYSPGLDYSVRSALSGQW